MNSQLEQYLEEVETRLHELPMQQRQEEVAEIRLHIGTMIEAHKELGCTEEEAVRQALAQFGKAQVLSQGLSYAFHRGSNSLQGNLLTATVVASIACLIMSQLRFCVTSTFIPTFVSGSQMNVVTGWWVGTLFIFPLLQGWLTAMAAPRKAVQGVALASVLSLGTFLIVSNFSGFLPAFLPSTIRLQMFVFETGWWLVCTSIAMLGAKAGAGWKKTRLRRDQASIAG